MGSKGHERQAIWELHAEAARVAYWRADQIARSEGAQAITPRHLLTAILEDPEGHARKLLDKLSVEVDLLFDGASPSTTDIGSFLRAKVLFGRYRLAITPQSRDLIWRSVAIARDELKARAVGTEHLLLALAETEPWSSWLDRNAILSLLAEEESEA